MSYMNKVMIFLSWSIDAINKGRYLVVLARLSVSKDVIHNDKMFKPKSDNLNSKSKELVNYSFSKKGL